VHIPHVAWASLTSIYPDHLYSGKRPFLRQTGDPCHKAGLRVEQRTARAKVNPKPWNWE